MCVIFPNPYNSTMLSNRSSKCHVTIGKRPFTASGAALATKQGCFVHKCLIKEYTYQLNLSSSAQGKRVPRPVEIFHLFVIPFTAPCSHVYCSAGLWYKCIPVSLSELDQFGWYYPTKSISGKIDSGCIRSEQMLCCSKCSFILCSTSVLLSKSPVRAIICNIFQISK